LIDGQAITALTGVMGALVGGFASLASTWLGARSQSRRDLIQREVVKRETVYSDFIDQAARLLVSSATHRIDEEGSELERVVSVYAIAGRIRLFASEQVILEAEKVIARIILQYGDDNLSPEQLRTTALERKDDHLKAFSIACKQELRRIQKAM
jgi:hypothetical protein